MKTIRNIVVAALSCAWLVGMDCGSRPGDLNLRYMVLDQGGSINLMWDNAEGVTQFILYRDDSVIDTLPPDSTSYLFDSTGLGKVFKVVAEGARVDGILDLSPYVDSFDIYEYDFSDTTPSGVIFNGDGTCELYNTKQDTVHRGYIQAVLTDDVPDSTDFATLKIASGQALGLNYVNCQFAVNLGNVAPTPDTNDPGYAYAGQQYITAPEYAMWIVSTGPGWTNEDNFVRLTAVNVDPSGYVTVRYAYQKIGGLRWFPY